MEKSVKNVYEISCNWFANNADSKGKKESSWKGQVLTYDDNGLIGVATDSGSISPTHILVGVLVDGEGLSIVKINKNNPDYDPIYFDAFKNINGAKNAMYGDFSTTTFGGIIPLGHASFDIKKKQMTNEQIANLIFKFNEHALSVQNTIGLSNIILQETLRQNNLDLTQKIQLLSQVLSLDPLPETLQTPITPQNA